MILDREKYVNIDVADVDDSSIRRERVKILFNGVDLTSDENIEKGYIQVADVESGVILYYDYDCNKKKFLVGDVEILYLKEEEK
jgi:hypothetical protein